MRVAENPGMFLADLAMGIWQGETPGELVRIPLGRPATVADLKRTKLKAEIVGGELIAIGPAGHRPGRAAGKLLISLCLHEEQRGGGYAMGPRVAFIVDLPNRLSFCPDVSWWVGDPEAHYFPHGAPLFAVEIRDPNEYDDEAERRYAARRVDYFAAGTRVVWDVDVLRDVWIRSYHAGDPENPIVFRRGEIADADPAVPGWRLAVDELFR